MRLLRRFAPRNDNLYCHRERKRSDLQLLVGELKGGEDLVKGLI